jgi:cytidine deaminase
MTSKELIEMAKKAKTFAYAPYSGFQVGAALQGKSGKVYTGCNIENAAYGATNCAERTAIFKAISEGEREFESIAIVSSAEDVTYPCGICRQVMAEHMKEATIYFENKQGDIVTSSVKEVMPFMFDNEIPNRIKGE